MERRLLIPAVALSLAVVVAGCGSKSGVATKAKSASTSVTSTSSSDTAADKKTVAANKTEKSVVAKSAPGSFSADMISTLPDGKSSTAKMAVDGEKTRIEMSGQTIIVRKDKGKMWMLNKANKSAMEMPVTERMGKETTQSKIAALRKLKAAGQETIDGYLCDKYVVTDKGRTSTTWVARENSLPVKVEANGATILFKNIKVGKQPSSLFELDPGYKIAKMPAMPAMPKNMPKNMAMPRMPR